MGAPQARVQLTGERLDLNWPAFATCAGLEAECRLRDGTVHRSSGWTAAPAESDRYRTTCGPLQLVLELLARDGCVRVRLDAEATGAADIVEVAIASRALLRGSPPAWMLYNGYQSWDPAGHLPAGGGLRESWWTVGLADADGAGIAAAAAHARSCCTRFTLSDGVFRTAWREAETPEWQPVLFRASPGATWGTEEVRLAAGADVRACIRSLLVTPQPRGELPAIGWLSWYHFGPLVRREDVLSNAEVLATAELRGLGYRLVQIDDGWQETYGEWVTNTKFPGGLRPVCDEIRGRGQVPGLWTAPFLVSTAAELASEAPEEWFVHHPATGERVIDPRHRVFGPLYVLDPSVREVRTFLCDLFAGFSAAGVRYFKIDFLYAGAYMGTSALRSAVEAIREGVGDAPLVASGTPLLPVAGLVDGCRIGPDTATPMPDFETMTTRPTIFGDEVLAVARNAAARFVLQPWFRLDADVVLAGGNLSVEQGRQLATIAALSGGPFLASDDLAGLPPDRMALLTNPEVIALVGGQPAVPDWEPNDADRPPTHWRRGSVLAVFNWDAETVEVPVRAPGASGARDLWAREELPDVVDGTILVVPGHGVRLLRLTEG
jgi:alpha-galactosidase